MENNLESKGLDQAIKASEETGPQFAINKDMDFVSVDQAYEDPEYDAYIDMADTAAIQRLDQQKDFIEKYGSGVYQNMALPTPSMANDTYDPQMQRKAKVPGDTISRDNSVEQTIDEVLYNQGVKLNQKQKEGNLIASPLYSDKRANSFDRYYHHPKFATLGYSPYANNSEYYNANSTAWDDLSRTWTSVKGLFGIGFTSGYVSVGDGMDGKYGKYDSGSAGSYEDFVDIGMSDRGGTTQFFNNLLVNSGYTFGIIGSIALEELALVGLEAVTFGGATPLVAARSVTNAAKLAKAGKRVVNSFGVGRMATATMSMVKALRNADIAMDFYSVGKFVGKGIAPETYAAIKGIRTAKNTAGNLTNMRKAATTFGGFYRDVRSLNLAMAESKLEGGMLYNERMDEGMREMQATNFGGPVTDSQMARIQENAAKAGFASTMQNLPLIFATNQLVLGNAFGGFNKSFARMANQNIKGGARRIIKTSKSVLKDGTKALDVFADAGAGLKGVVKSIANAGVKGNLRTAAGASLRYFAANFGEGIQELGQEAIATGTGEYYKTLLKDPGAGGLELYNTSLASGIGSQFSEQGFETFMSGFLMGGVVAGPQKLFFQGVPAIYKRISDPKAFAEYKANKEKAISSLVDTYNDTWNKMAEDPNAVFDQKKFKFLVQKQAAEGMLESAFESDQFGFIDSKDIAKFNQIYDVISNGGARFFEQQLNDYANLDDASLAQAFPTDKQQIKSGKLRKRFTDMIDSIGVMEENFNKLSDKYENPFDESRFEKGTREFQEEAIKRISFDHARYLYMFTNDGFSRALERADSIFQSLESDPLFKDMEAKDITVLLDNDSINNELKLLLQEELILKDDKTQKGKVKEIRERAKRLGALQAILSDKKNLKKDGSFDQRKILKLKTEFHNYVRFMAKKSGSFVNEEVVMDALKKIVDHKALKGRARVYYKSIEYLNNPERFTEIYERTNEFLKSAFKDVQKNYKEAVTKYIETKEQVQLLNEIAKLTDDKGNMVIPDPNEVKIFSITNNPYDLKTFYTEAGTVTKRFNATTVTQINEVLGAYAKITEQDTVDQKTEEAQAEETRADVEEILSENGVEIELPTGESKVYTEILRKGYNKYLADQANLNKNAVDFNAWINTENGKAYRQSFAAIKKIWIANDKLTNPNRSLTPEQIENDANLISWLTSQEGKTNDLVAKILDKTGLTISEITGIQEQAPTKNKPYKGRANTDVIESGSYVALVQTETENKNGEKEFLYQLFENSTGRLLDAEILSAKGLGNVNAFLVKGQAISAYKRLESDQPNSAEFPFDGVEGLSYGQKVYKDGIEYTILSNPKKLANKGTLLLIPSDAQSLTYEEKVAQKVFINVKKGGFKDFYTLEEIDSKRLPNSVSRLNFNELVTPYGAKNEDETSWSIAKQRYFAIISELSQEDLKTLELVVTLNPEAGKKGGQYSIPGKESNEYITRTQSKYLIGIRTNSGVVQDKIDALFAKDGRLEGVDPFKSDARVFAFLPNQNFQIEIGGKVLTVDQLNPSQSANIFNVSDNLKNKLTDAQVLEIVKEKYAINNALLAKIDEQFAENSTDGNTAVLSKEQLPEGFSFNSTLGNVVYDKSDKKLTDLEYNAADENGNYLIYQLEKSKTGRSKIVITNLEEGAREELINKVETQLEKQGLLSELSKGTDAYKAAVLLPDGTYRLVPLKSESLENEATDKLFVDLITRAQKTQEENKNGKDPSYNKEWNDNQGVWISSYPGITVKLEVNKYGKVQLSIVKDGKWTNLELTRDEVNAAEDVEVKIQKLIDRANETTVFKTAVSSPETGSKIGFTLSRKNFRTSYSRSVSVNELIEKTTTQAKTQVVGINTLEVFAPSGTTQSSSNTETTTAATFTPTRDYTDAEGNPIPVGPEMTTASSKEKTFTAEESEYSILDLEDSEFDAYKENDFRDLPSYMIEHIVNKIISPEGGVALRERERQVFESPRKSEIMTRIAILGGTVKETEISETPLSKIDKELTALKKKLQEGKKGAAKRKALKDSKEYQTLLKNKKAIESAANKVMPAYTAQDSENVDVFMAWAANNLPDFISIEDIGVLGSNLKAGGVRVGAFALNLHALAGGMKIGGTIYTGAKSPFRYHEAFHGVFRMLLSDTEINKYLSIARKEVRSKLRAEGKNFLQELERFRNSADTYTNMSKARLEQEYYEEYLANEFEAFKQNPKKTKTDSGVKSLFTRIMEWIKSVFNSYNKSELLTLFENIDGGKYQTASIANNQFINTLTTGVTVEANALIPYDSIQDGKKVGFYYLDSAVADPMIRSIAAMYLQAERQVTEPGVKRSEIFDGVIDDFYNLYDPENVINLDKTDAQREVLENIILALDNYLEVIKPQVYSVLNVIDSQITEEEYNTEYFEDSVGLRSIDQWDTDASLIGGLESTPRHIRAYLATTTKEETDFFGNRELKAGVPLIIPVEFNKVYNGLLKAVKNIEDPKKMLRTMYFFGQDNLETGAVVSRLLNDLGVSKEALLSNSPLPLELKNPSLFQAFTKAFENFRVEYIFSQRDSAGNVIMYSAAERDDINSQVDVWSQAWNDAEKKIKVDSSRKETVEKTLGAFGNLLLPSSTQKTDKEISELSQKYSEKIFELTGIRLSKQYIAFSLTANRPQTEEQEALQSVHSNETPITEEAIRTMNILIQNGEDIFNEGAEGMYSRLRTLAINNAPFDETIGLSVFKNSEGNLVYAHQKPTYHLKQVEKLNTDVQALEKLKQENPYLKNNYLLNNDAFIQMSAENRQKILRIAGTAVGNINTTEEEINESISGLKSRSTYGNFTPQEFALNLLNSYTYGVNTKSNKANFVEYYDTKLGKNVKVALAPSLIRVLESSNTGDMMNLPVIKAVEFVSGSTGAVKLTDEAVDTYISSIETEYDRILRESALRRDNPLQVQKLGYNTEGGRAYKLHNSALFLPQTIRIALEEIATRDDAKSLSAALSELDMTMADLKSNVVESLEQQFELFKDELKTLNINEEISSKVREGLVNKNVKATPDLIQSNQLLNLNYDQEYNLKQIFFNNWINTKSINEILLGDQAVTLKNGVDAIKRAKAQNASTVSAYSAITAPELGINHPVDDISLVSLEEPIGVSSVTGDNIDIADAQMWMTTKAFRYMFFGFGKLTPMQAKLMDKVEAGETISSEDIFGQDGYVSNGVMLNSKKLVYFDGSTFIKMSAFILTPQLTSNKVVNANGEVTYTAKENRKELHDLRVKLEGIEAIKDKQTLGIAAPLSALKMLKQKVKTLEEVKADGQFSENDFTSLSAKNMGLQLEVPSNKLETVEPSQIKAIITSEQKDDVFVKELGLTVGQIRKAYNEAISARVELKFKNKRNLIFTFDSAMEELKISMAKDKLTPNLMSFLRYATEGLKASQSSSQLLEFFSTEEGEQKYDLNNPITINKFEQLFLSYLSKGVLAEKQPGHALALVSSYGMNIYRRVYSVDENGIPDRSEVIREKYWNKMSDKPEIVEFDTLLGRKIPKEGVVVLDRLRSGVKEYDSKGVFTGQRYTEMLMPAHFKSVMDLVENGSMTNIPEVISKMFAIRIPSQDNHSTINIKHVDFLPAFYGSSATFAQELVEISGADFDIDKVYAQIKEFYVKDKKFIEYGTAKNNNDAYDDYINYINEKVNKPGTIYSEAYQLYKTDEGSARIQNSATEAEVDVASDAGASEQSIKALQMLGLPITKGQYVNYIKKNKTEPYEAPYNNEVLDYKYALMGNTGVTESTEGVPISYTAANLEILQSELEALVQLSETFALRDSEDSVDIDNLLGQIKAFTSNKGAAIGAIVSPNVNLSLLTEYKIKLKGDNGLNFNNVTYDSFATLTEKLTKTKNGLRKQDIISSLITMATDNAKERLVAKLGLNKAALSLVGTMTGLGVPIRTSLLLVNNPLIRDIYNEALNKKDKLDPGVKALSKTAFENISKRIGNLKAKVVEVVVTDELLLEAINRTGKESIASLQADLAILDQFISALNINDEVTKMTSVSNLTKGLGQNMAAVAETRRNISDLMDSEMMDLKSIYQGDTWLSKYVEIFQQISDEILPSTFLSASESFQAILDEVVININAGDIQFTEETLAGISRDLLSYITIKAYINKKLGADGNSQSVATLSNDLIYPGDYQSINEIVDRMRSSEAGQDNFFLDSFAVSVKSDEQSNNTGTNQLNANTFRSLNAAQKIDLQTSFAKLYGSLETKDDALSIINYIMVKDGLQLSSGSLLDAVSPFIMESYLSQIETANQALRSRSTEEVFGLSFTEMKKEFIEGYLLSNKSNALLQTFISSPGFVSKGIKIRDNKATVAWNDKQKIGGSKLYFRVKNETDAGVITSIDTYKRDENSQTDYTKIDTIGSNQQNAIGFMFGERPTYNAVREYVKEKNALVNKNDDIANNSASSLAEEKSLAAAYAEEILNDQTADIVATEDGITVNGEDIADAIESYDPDNVVDPENLEGNSVSGNSILNLISSDTIKSVEVPEYTVKNLVNEDGTKRLASTNGNQIFLNPVESVEEFFNYVTGKQGGQTSKQKEQVILALEKEGYTVDQMRNILDTKKKVNTFLVFHEQDHIDNNDKDVYWKNGKDLLTQDKIDIEVRATVVALKKVQEMQAGTEQTELDTSENQVSETPLTNELMGQLKFALDFESKYNILINFWDNNVQGKPEMRSKLRAQNILSLQDMIDAFNNSSFEETGVDPQDQFLEKLGCL